ncbi:hypothetical protein K466DRAFT_665889, partial [Polyporus arcularius HHB13444]
MTRQYKELGDYDFLDHIFTISTDVDHAKHTKLEVTENPFLSLSNAEDLTEGQLSAAVTDAVNTNQLAPGLIMALSDYVPDSHVVDEVGQKVHCALFDKTLSPKGGRPHWGDQLVPIAFKRLPICGDPFGDVNNEAGAAAEDRKKVRGQINNYVELVFSVQQRLHLIMILFLGRKFRLLFWDRSGAVVSNAVDYYEEWQLLCDILWRVDVLSRCYPEAQPAFSPGTPIGMRWTKLGWRAPTTSTIPHANLLETRSSLTLSTPSIPDGDGVRNFLVGRPHFRAKGLIGRGTRGYVALDTSTGRFTWLKDAWRVDYDDVGLEGDILNELNEAGVPNIPTLVCHGDIRGQTTKTPDYWALPSPPLPEQRLGQLLSARSSARTLVNPPGSASLKRKRAIGTTEATLPKPKGLPQESLSEDDPCPLRRHKHYRVVVEEVCMPLAMFKNGKHLVWIILDCVYAHQGAAENNVIHRDVSGGNILIYPKVDTNRKGIRELRWAGLLTDWELSKKLDAPRKARQPERTGTWQSMSVAILKNPRRVVEIPDDLESFFHVLLYHAIRYLHSNLDELEVGDWIEDFFDCYTVTDDVYYCGKTKLYVMTTSAQLTSSKGKVSFESPMDELLGFLLSSFKALYAVTAYDEEQESLAKSSDGLENIDPDESSDEDYDYDYDYDFGPSPGALKPFNVHQPVKPVQEKYVPSEQDREVAKNVTTHGALAMVLHEFLHSKWAKSDKVGDRVPIEWQPKKHLGPSVMSASTRHKRQLFERPRKQDKPVAAQ